ncbi:hypothetical protein JT55_01095 [Rhodovulum sp. NI22]|nr:hypothetical protein JT55_01095 [Rhodovulum sp. NI22]|tara:strand:+ start:1660 stop:2763 length:1104 start_codon:yes stop_codon:yes gene_type:complete
MNKVFMFLCASIMLAACTPRPGTMLVPEAAEIGDTVKVYYGSTRTSEKNRPEGIGRAIMPTYGEVSISVPPEHKVGRMEVASKPDPEKHFALSSSQFFGDPKTFRSALSREFRKRPVGEREAVIFVHGFNTNFAEGVFRAAQLDHDFDIDAVSVTYTWPSRANPVAYAYDRDSALFARDGLEELITEVRRAGADNILLVGHSMGAQVTMETLRQMAIRSPAELHRTVDSVILLAPDIDVDLFRAQAARIGRLPEPFVVIVSERDRVLDLSARLTGERNRLGNVRSIEKFADLNVTIVDVTGFSGVRDLGHFTIGSSPALISILGKQKALETLIKGDTSGQTGLVQGTVLTVQQATEIVLSPITSLAQ